MIKVAVLTVSTSCFKGTRKDMGGPRIINCLGQEHYEQVASEIVPDDVLKISKVLIDWSDSNQIDLIVTTGGTGVAKSDVTPEACIAVFEKEIPGIAEAIRRHSASFTSMAMLSRSVAGIRGNTLIISLPGSPKAIDECLDVVKPVLQHTIELLQEENVYDHPNS
jgi:molybdopterin adenylyltransferase